MSFESGKELEWFPVMRSCEHLEELRLGYPPSSYLEELAKSIECQACRQAKSKRHVSTPYELLQMQGRKLNQEKDVEGRKKKAKKRNPLQKMV